MRLKTNGTIDLPIRAKNGKRVADLLAVLRSMGSEKDRAGMARYGINVENAFGVSVYKLRWIAKRLGTDHALALSLWATGNHEARLLACFVDDPAAVTRPAKVSSNHGHATSIRGTSATRRPPACST